MKKVFLISAIAFSSFIYKSASAQIGVHVGFGINLRRVYAPVEVVEQPQPYVDQNDDYYYLPEVDAYYNVYEQCYYYFDGENWVSAAYLPGEYSTYDWRNAPHYEVRAVRPYLRDDFYRNRFHGREMMAWRGGNYGNRDNRSYADRGFRNNGQRYDDRMGERVDGRMNPQQFRDERHDFDNQRPDGGQYQRQDRGARDNREQFDNHMNDRYQPNINENRVDPNRDRQNLDNNRQFDRQQPNENHGFDNQQRGRQGFDNNRQQQNQNRGFDNRNRKGQEFQRNNNDNNQKHEGGRYGQRMA